MSHDCLNIVQCADVRPLENAQSHITSDNRTLTRTLSAHCEKPPRTLSAQSKTTTSLKALADAVLGASLQCANVRALGNAQPHITPKSRTLPRTLSAHYAQNPRTLPPPTADADEVIRLVKQCGRFYGFSESEFSEAIAAAIADLDAALTCFRSIYNEIERDRA